MYERAHCRGEAPGNGVQQLSQPHQHTDQQKPECWGRWSHTYPCLEGYGFHFDNAIHLKSRIFIPAAWVFLSFASEPGVTETHVLTVTSGAFMNHFEEQLLSSSSSYIGAPFYKEGLHYSFCFQKLHLFCIPRRHFYSPRKVKQKHWCKCCLWRFC